MADLWLWQGFSAEWRYNHRLNRLGSAVVNGTQVTHSAASGTGPDVATVATNAVRISSDGVHTGEVTLRLQGAESELLSASQTVFVPNSAVGSWQNAEAVLQGFDTYAAAGADKPRHLSFSVGQPTQVSGGWSFPVNAQWMGSCSSAECSPDGTTDQTLRVYYALIASNEPLRLSSEEHTAALDWTTTRKPSAVSAPLNGVQGINSVSLTLSDEMHWLSYEARINENTLSLGFENWRGGMMLARPIWSLFSYRQAGSAQIEVQTTQLALSTSDATTIETKRKWKGMGRDANSDAASDRTPLSASSTEQ